MFNTLKKVTIIFLASYSISAFSQKTIKIAISAAPNNLVPFFSTDANSQNINRLVHTALVDFNEKMQFVCVGCESFKESIVGEKHIFKFTLRPNITFSDNSPVTTQDVKKSYEYFAKNEKIKSTFMGAYETIEAVNIIDEKNVEIVFKSFSLENLSNLSLLKIVKINNPLKDSLEPQDVIGCGDYQIKEIQPLEILITHRRGQKPNLNFKVVKDETTLALKLINKEIDLSVANMSPRKVYWLKSQPEIKIWDMPSGNYQFMGINHRREIFQDRRVRKAFSLLIPREEILKYKLKNTASLSNGMFSKAFGDMYEPLAIDSHNPELSRKLLSEAGWVKNKKGFLERNGKVLEIDWKVSNNKASIEIVEVLKNAFEKEGMVVNLSIQEWGTYMSAFKAGKFDIVVGQWIGFTGPDMLRFVFHSSNLPPKGGNRVGYSNLEIDQVLDSATIEIDAIKRTHKYKQALKMINEDYASINLWHPNIIWIGRSCIDNVKLESTGSFYPLKNIEFKCE